METRIEKVFSENLKYYLSVSGKMQKDLADYLKVSPASITKWMRGYGFPQLDRIDQICSFFGISRSDLVSERNGLKRIVVTDNEMVLLHKYDQLTIDGKTKLHEYLDLLLKSGDYEKRDIQRIS